MINLTEQQKAAVQMVQENQISLLSGGPGTGKTTAVLEIVNKFEDQNLKVTQAAPTGKAAKRMQEATGRAASTIHAMLGCQFDGNKFAFIHNAKNPLATDLVILDETSMITTDLMARVFEAINTDRGTKLLLVGDPYQLPSVGAGAVFRDFLAAGIFPHIELDVIHRNSGRIVEVCNQIKSGQVYFPDTTLDLQAENPINLIHVECKTPEITQRAVRALVCDRMPIRGYDPVDDIMTLSPVNKKGPLSCLALNRILRQELNPEPHRDPEVVKKELQQKAKEDARMEFRAGDKVIQCKNDKVETDKGAPTFVVNGDMGKIVLIDKKYIIVDFTEPDRRVVISKRENHLLHAYVITCHRAQGSEAPVVIVPIHQQFNFFLSNSWLYTALSRGKQIVITVGAFSTIERAIKNRTPNDRLTRLKQRFIEYDRKFLEAEFEGI